MKNPASRWTTLQISAPASAALPSAAHGARAPLRGFVPVHPSAPIAPRPGRVLRRGISLKIEDFTQGW